MALEVLIQNATTLVNASWVLASDLTTSGSGVVDSATLRIPSGSQTITGGMDAGTSLTNGINYFLVGTEFTGVIGSSGTPWNWKYTTANSGDKTNPGLLLGGGTMYFDPVNTVTRVRVLSGATLYIVGDGTITNLEVAPNGTAIRTSSSAVVTNVVNYAGTYIDEADNSNDFTSFTAIGSARSTLRCQPAALFHYPVTDGQGRLLGEPVTYMDLLAGITAFTSFGGRLYPIKGAIPTITQYGGSIDTSRVSVAMALGASAWSQYPFGIPVSGSAPVASIGTITYEIGGPASYQATAPSFPA